MRTLRNVAVRCLRPHCCPMIAHPADEIWQFTLQTTDKIAANHVHSLPSHSDRMLIQCDPEILRKVHPD